MELKMARMFIMIRVWKCPYEGFVLQSSLTCLFEHSGMPERYVRAWFKSGFEHVFIAIRFGLIFSVQC